MITHASVHGSPSPYVPVGEFALVFFGDIRLLGVAEAPNFIDLDVLAGQADMILSRHS